MAQVKFVSNRAGLNEVLSSPSGPVFKMVKKWQAATLGAANRATPADTGRLRGANEPTPVVVAGQKVVAGVENPTEYAMFVHEGTKPHVILPKNAKVLTWKPRGGARVFARKVNHPGTKAQPWLARAAEAASARQGISFTRGE